MLRDTQAAIDAVKDVGPVGIIGFCLGGSVAYAAATKLSGLSAAIGYYGGAVVRFADDKPKVPTQLHFGEKDAGIPLTDVETIRAKRPEVEIHVYPGAQHGFHCDERASYDKASADIAWPRSMAFFRQAFEEVERATVVIPVRRRHCRRCDTGIHTPIVVWIPGIVRFDAPRNDGEY